MRAICTLAACALAVSSLGAELPSERLTYLRERLGFSSIELGALNRGMVVARMVPTQDRREFAVVGIVKVGVPSAFVVDRLRNIVEYKQSELVLQVGRLSTPPRPEEIASLIVDRADIDDLRDCRPGDCGLRLTLEQIQRFRTHINWNARGAEQHAGNLLRQILLEEASAYLTHGVAGLGSYNDKKTPLRRDQAVETLLAHSPSLVEAFPEFREYLVRFPHARLDHVETFLYWSREKFGFRPVVSLTHVAIYRPPGAGQVSAVIASKQVYASHYFDASHAMTALVESDRPGSGVYMMYLNRTQANVPGGLLSGLARSLARSRTRSGVEEQLGQTRLRLEAEYRRTE